MLGPLLLEKCAFEHSSPGASFFFSVCRLKPITRSVVPSWDLPLCCSPFEPLEAVDIKFLSHKTGLFLALATAKRTSDIQALSIHPLCTQFAPGDTNFTLHPIAAYAPEVLPMSYMTMAFNLFAVSPPPFNSEEQRRLRSLGTYIFLHPGVSVT